MLHFPSKNTAAHTAHPAETARLHQLLGHHVWAFSNCRVDSPGLPVAEVDWLFYNSIKGTFLLSEWKRFPAQVRQVRDSGEKWALTDGTHVANPIEQVARQLDAVRRVLRTSVCGPHFPAADQQAVNVYQSVYCPQVDEATRHERLRYGIVHASLEELARTVERRAITAPLIVDGGAAQVALAEALAELFRCSVGSAVRRKLDPPVPVEPAPSPEPTRSVRIAAIHRELAALHLELASLLDAPGPVATPPLAPGSASAPAPARDPQVSVAPSVPQVSVAPPTPVALKPVTKLMPLPSVTTPRAPSTQPSPTTDRARTRLEHHVAQHLPTPRKASPATVDVVRRAFLSALQDDQLHHSGVHVGHFGALVKARLTIDTTPSKMVGGSSLGAWCRAQAAAAGLDTVKDASDPSVLRLKGR